MAFSIQSPAFGEGGGIPPKFTCEGHDLSPELRWSNAPSLTKSYVLIVDDPDAPGGTWTHWIVWNIPSLATGLPEAVPKEKNLDDGTRQGENDFKRIGYGGPCPPPGKPHRYFFRLYALGAVLDLKAGAPREDMESAMHEHVLTHTTLMGTYQR
jgi:Raf kinase inhibitor-like YbhB/YbcL family protein